MRVVICIRCNWDRNYWKWKKIHWEKSGTATTENGITIFAENFIYDKVNNILYANTNVKIKDTIKNIVIFSDKVTYLKNEEIIFSENKSKAETDGLTIIAKSFTYKKNLNTFNAKGNVQIIDETNNYSGFGENVTYFKNGERIVSKGNTTANIKSKYKFSGRDITILRDKNEMKSLFKAKLEDLKYTEYEFEEFIYFLKMSF